MITKFLILKKAFELQDWDLFSDEFTLLNEAILKAKDENKDEISIQDELLYLEIIKNGITIPLYEFYRLPEILSNLDSSIIGALNTLLSYPQENSQNTVELKSKYIGNYIGLMGLQSSTCNDDFVYDIDSWFDFHFLNYHNNSTDKHFIMSLRNLQETVNSYFPNLLYSNALFTSKTTKSVDYIWTLFYKSAKTKPEKNEYDTLFGAGDKIAVIKELAPQIAYRNLYKLNETLSNYNDKNNRGNGKTTPFQIFEQGIGNDKLYLSTDFEKGAFEVCDKNGKHLGEYFFSGKKNEDADKSGGHDIMLI